MKNLFRLFFVIFSLFFFVSCGGNENPAQNEDSGSDSTAFSLRIARDPGSSGCMNFDDCIFPNLSAINFTIFNKKEGVIYPVYNQSFPREKVKDLMKNGITGIKNADNATLVVSVFLNDDNNHAKWQGRAGSLKFKKGETTKVDILLYPVSSQSAEVEMPKKLTTARFGHSTTVLNDGRILVAGGFTSCGDNGNCQATESVEIIDMESGKVETIAGMAAKRAMHTALLLNDGSILFIGGVQSFSAVQQQTAFKNYPLLPYSQSGAVTTVEKYMPPYPKFNMMENNLGTPVENYTESVSVPEEIAFMTFQSILAKRISDSQIDVFLVGGVDADDNPSNKTYKFTVTDSTTENGSVSISEVKKFAETSSPMLLPVLAYSDGAVLAVGGRPSAPEKTTEETTEESGEETAEETKTTEVAASLISENESRDIETGTGNNIFFANSMALDDALYTFAGMPNKSGTLENSKENGVTRKWSLSDGSMEIFDKNENILKSSGGNVAFAGTLYDSEKNRFILVGGTSAENKYQVINATDLEIAVREMTDKRIMPTVSMVHSSYFDVKEVSEKPQDIIVIIGGTSAPNNTGSAANTIKINIL